MKEKPTRNLTIRITDQQYDWLSVKAESIERNKGWLIRRMIDGEMSADDSPNRQPSNS
ncbi:MAG: hypothetical protein LBL73_08850 [Synergistaceae bacterium]|jgi:hypothetical protein|nr:hypothetical protein [Synergistaceae bacterium]